VGSGSYGYLALTPTVTANVASQDGQALVAPGRFLSRSPI